ncbi:MAG TPA: PAS domain S-box protein [Burkholderiales bacterium]|nr:PAS domain S-box protein [Burkholderiales bacterium]
MTQHKSAGFILIALGVLGLSLPLAPKLSSPLPPMAFTTALSFLVAGVALLLARGGAHAGRRRTGVLGIVLAASAAFGLGKDGWMAGEPLAFLLAAAALIAASLPRLPRMAEAARLLALGVGAVPVLALAGILIDAELLFPRYPFAGAPIHTMFGLLALAVALWAHIRGNDRPLRADARIGFAAAMALMVVTFCAGVATLAVLQGRVQGMVRENLVDDLSRRADVVQELIRLREATARIAATRPAVQRNLRAIVARRDDGSHIANVRAVVQSFLDEGFSAIEYYDASGALAAQGGAAVAEPDLSLPLATPGNAELMWKNGFVLRHRLPMLDAGGLAGEVVVEQPLPALTRLAREASRAGETWDMGLCARRADELRCFPQRLNSRAFATPLVNSDGEALPMTRALRGETGTVVTRDYRGQNVVAAFAPVGQLGIGIVTKVDAAEIFRPIRDQLHLAVGALLLLVAVGTLFLRWQVRPLATGLADAEERFRALAETANDPIVSADGRGDITYFNKAAEQCFGYTRTEVAGKPLTLLMPERFRGDHTSGLRRVADGGASRIVGRTVELSAHRKDGSEFPIEISIASWQTARGRFFTAILRDITHRKRNEAHLRVLNAELEKRVKERAAGLTRAQAVARLAHVVTGPAGEFETWSETLLQLARLDEAGVPRTTREWLDLVHPEDRAAFRQAAVVAARNQRRTEVAYRLQRSDGAIVHVVQTMEPLDEAAPAGGRLRWFNTLQDVSAQKRTEEEIRALNEQLEMRVRQRTAELEAVNRELEAFSYSVSHDLRAPLRHIDGFADLLATDRETRLSEDGARYVNIMRDSVRQMGRLIDDLLAFSRMGRAEMRYQRVDTAALVAEVIASLKPDVGDRRVEWNVAPLPQVRADGAMLRQVWANLLGNAVKYTRQRAAARIDIGCNAGPSEIEFFVRDNGAGFNQKYAQKLFGVFQRLHRAEDFEGTGVGLANVRRIVTRHGGTTRAEGALDQGAVFYFTLPLTQLEDE